MDKSNLFNFDVYSSIQKNNNVISEALNSEENSFDSLNESDLEELDFMAENSGFCSFDLICMKEGVGYDQSGNPKPYVDEDMDYKIYESSSPGWLVKEVDSQTKEIEPKIKKALEGLQLKMTPAIQSLVAMYIKGLKKALNRGPRTSEDLFDIANKTSEHKRVVKILANSYSKIIKDNDSRQQSSLFSEDNKATAGNVATVQTAIKDVVFNIKQESNKHGEKNKVPQSVVNPKPWSEADIEKYSN